MGSRRGRVLLVFVVLAILTSIAPTARAEPTALRVSVYGDSVLLGAREALLAQFAGQPVTVDAVEDRSLLGAIGLFQSAGPGLGDVVVLDLGYNDVADAAVFRSRVDGAMAALAGVKRVLWLNQHDWGPGRAGMNAELVAAATRYPNLEVIDWNAEVTAHPDEVYGDAIHLTPSGQTAMAALVRRHYDDYVTSLTPTTTGGATSRGATTTETPTSTSAAAPTTAAIGAASAPVAADGDGGISGRDVVIGIGVAVVVALLALLAVRASVRRRAARRAARRAGRGARQDR